MASFLMLGKYTLEAVKGIGSERTKKAVGVIEESGGRMKSMYALLGEYDLALIVDFPGAKEAMKASIGLTKLTNISFITFPAISVEEFDKTIG